MTFSVKQRKIGDENHIDIEGYIDEHAVFPKIHPAQKLVISLAGVKGLNSSGTRTWIQWVTEALSKTPSSLVNCPFIFVKTFGHVYGSMPQNSKVDSFYVPFVSEQTEEKKNVLYVRDVNYFEDGTVKHPKIMDSKGNQMAPDVHSTYFRFLKPA